MSKRFLLILAALVVLFGGFLFFSKNKQTANAPGGNNGSSQVSNHTQGDGKKGVTLIEYGDYQCPACGAYFPVLLQVQQKYGNDITFQFRNFPLVQIHQNAMAAARAAEAADKQGKFWQMHDTLYQQQKSWESAGNASVIMEDFATQLGLNVDKFKQDFNSSAIADTINADTKAAQAIGATGTPTFVLNGKKLDSLPERSLEAFSKLVDAAISQASSKRQ